MKKQAAKEGWAVNEYNFDVKMADNAIKNGDKISGALLLQTAIVSFAENSGGMSRVRVGVSANITDRITEATELTKGVLDDLSAFRLQKDRIEFIDKSMKFFEYIGDKANAEMCRSKQYLILREEQEKLGNEADGLVHSFKPQTGDTAAKTSR